MTKDEFKRKRLTYSSQMEAALVCGNPRRSIEIGIENAKLVLAYPEFWPDDADPDWIRYHTESAIRQGEIALKLTRRGTS